MFALAWQHAMLSGLAWRKVQLLTVVARSDMLLFALCSLGMHFCVEPRWPIHNSLR